jgi:hypothetical protein
MVSDNIVRLATAKAIVILQQRVTDKMATLQATEKKATEARAPVLAIALLLKEERASATALEVEATAAALQLVLTNTYSSVPPPPSSGGDNAIVAMLHMQVCGI